MTALNKNTVRCPHCGAESINDDELCRFCGKAMAPAAPAKSVKGLVRSGFRALKGMVRPMTEEEHKEVFEETTFNLSNPADPIWDD